MARQRRGVLERRETRGERGYTTGYVMKETARRSAAFSRARQSKSSLVDTICRIAGLLMLAGTVAIFSFRATAA